MRPVSRLLSKIHITAGLILAFPLIIITLTGIVLGFYDQIRYAAPPYRLDSPVETPLSAASLAARLRVRYPDYHLDLLRLSTAPERAVRAALSGPDRITAFLHPGNGKELAVQKGDHQDWIGLLYALHEGEPFGLAGKVVASVSGGGVLVLWGAGLMLWRSRRKGRWGGPALPGRFRPAGVHRFLGFWGGGLLAILTSLGALLNFAGPLIARLDPPPRIESAPEEKEGLKPDLAAGLGAAARAYPQAPLERIAFPKVPKDPLKLRFQDGGWVFLHPDDYRILAIKSPTSHWTRLLYPLHSGRILGGRGPWLVAGLGLFLIILLVTGLIFWQGLRPK
ncbi:PepSY-associated TM helix domain-containing protein [Candidatus Manganitrophus noduliformans]|uniref:PepSY domain-containing protein n=1 Tax=Candidatus Manganitrophus noduliformans TaxID=2606439 RepID=A0A7X6DUC9_9BACT|nr:PepSY-associated TM helix domain-containing protein [Candidatus Manganitrophus noduliformans]NKE73561.1 PepSY domain-containing protein [Candidatus Manganitrophus noduliformans]